MISSNRQLADEHYEAALEAFERGLYNKASRMFKETLHDLQDESDVCSDLLNNVGEVAGRYCLLGNYFDAAALYRAILLVQQRHLGADHPIVHETSGKLTMALWQTGSVTPRMINSREQ